VPSASQLRKVCLVVTLTLDLLSKESLDTRTNSRRKCTMCGAPSSHPTQ